MAKKILLGIVSVLVLVVGVVLVLAATKPATFRVERSLRIAAPPAVVFANLDDFRRWAAWSPWERLDPNMKKTYAGPAQGVGANYAWSGNDEVGRGKMTVVESRPPERLGVSLEFIEPFAATNTTVFNLTPDATGVNVNWAMEGENNFVSKVMSVFVDMDTMIGKDFEKGLASLKEVSESGVAARADAPR